MIIISIIITKRTVTKSFVKHASQNGESIPKQNDIQQIYDAQIVKKSNPVKSFLRAVVQRVAFKTGANLV